VKLQLELLISEEYRIDSAEEFQRRLDILSEKLSDGSLDMLNQTYDDILRRNLRNQGTEASKSAKEALQWIACSGRPFNRTILVQAVKSNTKDSRSPDQLEKWCRNLFYANETGIIRFTHSSVREYVDSQYSLAAAHMMAAQTCIGSLTKRGDREEFASYSSSYWPFHCGQAGLNQEWEKTALGNRLLALLSPNSTLRSIWEDNVKISENLSMAFTHDGTRMVADNILMACQFNWLWYLVHPVNIEGVDFKRSLMISGGLGMHLAIKQRHQDVVRFLLARGVNTDRWNDGTPLGMAILTTQPVMVKLLLGVDSTDLDTEPVSLSNDGTEMQRSYAGVNERASFHDNTALHLAAIHNLPEIAQILCDVQDVDINLRNEKGATPLLDAAVVGSEGVVRILLNHPGIDLKPMGYLPEGRLSALHCTGSPAIAKMLLDHDPEISNLANPDGWTVLGQWLKPRESTGTYADAAYERDLQARLKLLLQSEGLESLRRNTQDLGDTEKVSALRHAAQAHSAAVLQLLYEDKRTDTEEKDESGNSLLHSATAHGNTEVVRFLLSKGVESTSKNDSGQTALMIADENQYAEIAKILGEIPS
jgi:ankyrin repeat protein